MFGHSWWRFERVVSGWVLLWLGIRSSKKIVRDVKVYFLSLWTRFPGIVLVWSDLITCKEWQQVRSVERLNKVRVKLNKEVGRHTELEGNNGEFLRNLNSIGIDLWSLFLQEAIETTIWLWRDEHGSGKKFNISSNCLVW